VADSEAVVIQRQFPLDRLDQAALLAQDQDSEVDFVEGLMAEEVAEGSGEDFRIVEAMVVVEEVLATKATAASETEVATVFPMLLQGLEVADLGAVAAEVASLVLQIVMVQALQLRLVGMTREVEVAHMKTETAVDIVAATEVMIAMDHPEVAVAVTWNR
jgi:hypothetical protein